MAGNYAQLLDIINNPTDHSLPAWDNNAKQIEGETIQQYLLTIIQSLTAGYQFMGLAIPSTSPGTPDQNVFYIGGAGTYANFGTSITVKQGQICVFKWNGSWTNTPIEIANSGFVNVNDINGRASAYESASAARSAVPTAYRKSGLNITYLLSTGWIIEQNLDATTATWADNASWQTIGPVGLLQNTEIGGGGYDLTIGGNTYNIGKEEDILDIKGRIISFDSLSDTAVSIHPIPVGAIIDSFSDNLNAIVLGFSAGGSAMVAKSNLPYVVTDSSINSAKMPSGVSATNISFHVRGLIKNWYDLQDEKNIAVCLKNPKIDNNYTNLYKDLGQTLTLTTIGDYVEFYYRQIAFVSARHRIFYNNSNGFILDIDSDSIIIGNINQSATHKFLVPHSLKQWSRIRIELTDTYITTVYIDGVEVGKTTMGNAYKLSANYLFSQYTKTAFAYCVQSVVFNIGGTETILNAIDLSDVTCNKIDAVSIIPFDSSSVVNTDKIQKVKEQAEPNHYNLFGKYPIVKKTQTGNTIFVGRGCNYQVKGNPTSIKSGNRFLESSIITYATSYNNAFTITKENYGIKAIRAAQASSYEFGWIACLQQYTAEYTGKLFVSLEAYTKGDIRDLGALIQINGVNQQRLTGIGRYVWELDVTAGDVIKLYLYLIADVGAWLVSNELYYKNIQFQYGTLTDFKGNEDGAVNADNLYPSCIIEGSGIELTYQAIDDTKKIQCVCVGDSITGMYVNKTGYPDVLTRKSIEINAINCGFPGNTLTKHSVNQTIAQDAYNAFSFIYVVDAIVSGDYDTQLDNIANIPTDNRKYYQQSMDNLTQIDFTKVDFLVMLYGTNDWSSGRAFDSGSGTTKENCYEDAFIYCVTQLMEKYPNLSIVVLSPYWRKIPELNVNDSNVDAINGLLLKDAAKKIYGYAKDHYNLPAVNLYEDTGVNVYTNRYYTMDNVHPNVKLVDIIAEIVEHQIKTLQRPL